MAASHQCINHVYRYEEALQLIQQSREYISEETILKVQNGYLEMLLKNKDTDKLRTIIPEFLSNHTHLLISILIEDNRDRWEHWINRLMQKKLLTELIAIIPKENPRLDYKFYTKIFEYFLEVKDFKSIQELLNIFPNYLINQDHLLEVIKKMILEN